MPTPTFSEHWAAQPAYHHPHAAERMRDCFKIPRLFSCLPAALRSCLFVGDTIVGIDDDEVHGASDVTEMLDDRPAGVPLTLRLRQPALRAALAARRALPRQRAAPPHPPATETGRARRYAVVATAACAAEVRS